MNLPSLRIFYRISGTLVLFILLLTSCSGSKKIFSVIERNLDSSPFFVQGFSGLAIYDPLEEKMLFEYNSGKYFTPASTTKLFTFYSGLKILGDSIPGIRYATRNDSLIFSATADPSLLHPDLPSTGVYDFLKNTEHELFYLPRIISEKSFGPGWAWDDYNASYAAERSTLPIYGNQVAFDYAEGFESPQVTPNQFTDSITVHHSEVQRITRNLHNNQFQIPGRKIIDQQKVPFITSEGLAVTLLEDTIHRNIEILDPAEASLPEKPFFSVPADTLYQRMLMESDNFVAEQLLLLAAEELSDTLKSAITIDYMKKNFLQDLPDETIWVDGSGLSRYNLTTPRNLVKLLEKIKEETSYHRLFQLLPQGGKTGTLRNHFKAATPYVYAKTGSLSNNYSLSGFLLTKRGKILIFSFMNSNSVVPPAILKQEMERILKLIRENH